MDGNSGDSSRGSTAGRSTPGQMPFGSDIGPLEDLTGRARLFSPGDAGVFEGEPQYEAVFDLLVRTLYGRVSHVALLGDRGVGRDLLLADLARRAAFGQYRTLRDWQFILVDCRHTAPEQSAGRLASILALISERRNLAVCVAGFGSLLRGARGETNKHILLSACARLRSKLIGLLDPREYEELIADDAEMTDIFACVPVPEPNVETAERMVTTLSAGLGHLYSLQIGPESVREAVVLSDAYILHERLPAKALKMLREACEDLAFERQERGSRRDTVEVADVVRVVSRASGAPEETLRGVAQHGDYEQTLGLDVVGQPQAVREVATELGLIKAGLTDPDKPASVMLFIGQTGTGKTEMAKALARLYSRSKRQRTYTLGNFIESHSVAGIIGVPPGYVGHEQGGRIVSDLLADPYCVFLLDEADKAHPDVLQPFLNLFDEGWICDQRGVKAYADKAVFILTTNVGQRMLADMAKQGKTPEEMATRMKDTLAQIRHTKANRPVFPPEFLSRIKRVIIFNPLGREALEGICRKHIRQMQESWCQKRHRELVIDDQLLEYISDESHRRNEKTEGREGGRIVRKLLAELVESPIQRAATAQPEEYQACQRVVVKPGSPPLENEAAPQISVHFESVAGSHDESDQPTIPIVS